MRIAVSRETEAGEPRVAATPETVKKLKALGAEVAVARGAGVGSGILDADYEAAGATVEDGAESDADIVLKVRRPSAAELGPTRRARSSSRSWILTATRRRSRRWPMPASPRFAMELMPRITRAQSMDVLSSQANLAGYRAVIDAPAEYGRALPMMMTAAGTVPAAKMFIMGVGVAGLQAIATARRLGAVVTATDVRPATKEQVESLGAKFIAVEDDEFKQAETAGGYAKEMSKEYQAKQAALVAEHIKKQDIVITTALIPGRPAPKLVSRGDGRLDAAGLGASSISRSSAAATSKAPRPARSRTINGVKIVGHLNVPGRLAASASALYAKNLLTFLEITDRQEREEARGQLGRRDRKGARP